MKQIFSSFSGLMHADWEKCIGTWLAGYVDNAVEIENLIFRQINEDADADDWENVRGLMTPFGASISSALAFGRPCKSAFVQIPRLQKTTQAGRALSLLLDMVTPDSFAMWENGNDMEKLRTILVALDDEFWRAFACRILFKAANMAGKHAAALLILETYEDIK